VPLRNEVLLMTKPQLPNELLPAEFAMLPRQPLLLVWRCPRMGDLRLRWPVRFGAPDALLTWSR
jgi:hypothetical protein